MTDEELVERAKKGDNRAFRQLVERYEAFVFTKIVHMVKQRELAEDLAQETFLQVYRSLPSFDGRARFSTWLYRIAHHKVIDWTRSRAKKERSKELALRDVYTSDDSLEEQVVNRDTSNRLFLLIHELPQHYRDVLLMYFGQELSVKEIAAQLNVPHKTVQTRLVRGKKRLFQRWQEVNGRDLPGSSRTDVASSQSSKR